jgi:O-antigen biosynthesis protein WbqP
LDLAKRLIDLSVALSAIFFLAPLILLIALVIKMTSPGPILYWSDRVGQYNSIFKMPKFRSMRIDTPVVATHLLGDAANYLTPIGSLLRKSSLDEIPQIWSILIGDMSLVGPRPALFNQCDLIELRSLYGIDKLVPGLTGWAQINGRDELPIAEKVELERVYLENKSFLFDLKIITLTIIYVILARDVSH